MPIDVTFRQRAPGGSTVDLGDGELHSRPSLSDALWRATSGYEVAELEEGDDGLIVWLVRAAKLESELRGELPEEWALDGGRSATTGRWMFEVIDSDRRPLVSTVTTAADMREAAAGSVERAIRHWRRPH